MRKDERQVAPTLAGIRRDHVARYEFVAKTILPRSRVIDFACGIGYGCKILADAGHEAYGFDIEPEALDYGREHYATAQPLTVMDGSRPGNLGEYDVAVSFETIEHIADPRPLLRALRRAAPGLIASVPNEEAMPWSPAPGVVTAYHFRHYTPAQFVQLLAECGWRWVSGYGQRGPESEVEGIALDFPAPSYRTLIAVCERDPDYVEQPEPAIVAAPAEAPVPTESKHITIVGLGPSAAQYLRIVQGLGGRHKYSDEVWCINALGNVFDCDVVFHMDDVRIQQIRAEAAPESNIAAMIEWMKAHPGPIITSRTHPDYPGLVEFPLEDVLNEFPQCYFNSTAAYAVAYAIWTRATKISLFGCDFTYPDAHDAEKGRACVEYWLGVASERGIQLVVPKTTSLLDAMYTQDDRFYGFGDTRSLAITREQGRIKVRFTEREQLPSADDIEARYDHSVHPNPLVTA